MENSWKFHHMAVIVRDVDKAVEYYQSLGIATIIGPEGIEDGGVADIRTYPDLKAYGKPADASFNVIERTVWIGSLQLEFMQPIKGESTFKEFLDSKGEGVHHIAFTVDDFDKEVAELVEKGIPVVLSGTSLTIGRFTHFDISKVGDVILKLYQPVK